MDKDFLKFMSFVAFMEAKKKQNGIALSKLRNGRIPSLLSEENPTLLRRRFSSAASGCPKSR